MAHYEPLDGAAGERLMGVLDAPLGKVAKKLIDKLGTAATLTYVTTGAYNTATRKAPTTSTTASVNGVFREYRLDELGDLIQSGDAQFIIPAKDLTAPEPKDTITIAAVVWQIVRVGSVMSGDDEALFDLHLRK